MWSVKDVQSVIAEGMNAYSDQAQKIFKEAKEKAKDVAISFAR